MATPIAPTPFGKYVIVANLASGGMAEVLLGVENAAGAARRFVGLKRVRPECRSDPRYLEYFLGEARLSMQCAHPNLPQVYELGFADDLHYLALEYIRGVTLLDLLRAARRANTRLSTPAVVAIASGVAAGLQYLHELRDIDGQPLRVIHRDVSPANVMVSYDGAVKLIDLGIARNAMQSHHTTVGTFKGKFAYQAPELIRNPAKADHRADIFLLGIVMHESLTGRSLFRGDDNRDTLLRMLNLPIPDPGAERDDVPPALTAVIRRALARDPAERYGAAGELLADLEYVADQARIPRSARQLRDELHALCGPPLPLTAPPLPPAPLVDDELDIDVVIDEGDLEDYVIEECAVHEATTIPPDELFATGSDCGLPPDPEYDALLDWLDWCAAVPLSVGALM